MKTNPVTPPEWVVKALSKPNDRNSAKAVGALLSWANSQSDHRLLQRSSKLLRFSISLLKAALPDTDPELIGGVFADLLDLWETGQKLDQELRKLTKLRFPQDRERLRDILVWIEAIQLDMASFWISEVKKDLPKLFRALDKLERESRLRRSGRTPARLAPNRGARTVARTSG
jgi:hypothetical protein